MRGKIINMTIRVELEEEFGKIGVTKQLDDHVERLELFETYPVQHLAQLSQYIVVPVVFGPEMVVTVH
jgi:hypothetical protein